MTPRKRNKFHCRPLHKAKEPPPDHYYLTQRVTFWIAVFSVLAFVTGNMMGQHGWRVFWKSVMGRQDDSLIVYTGTVPPIARIPDFHKWSLYGEGGRTFADVPQQYLISMPRYNGTQSDQLFYSIEYMGSYATGLQDEGSHPGVDIRTPPGTPVQSVMNGVVQRVDVDSGGFGKYLVIRHPNVPDPSSPDRLTTLYTVYAHLSEQLVAEGQVVEKGQEIALSGQTGLASGPHLHFQMERDKDVQGNPIPHPFWPYSSAEARAANLTFNQAIDQGLNQDRGLADTVNPFVYIQAQYAPVQVVENDERTAQSPETSEQRRQERIQARVAKRQAEFVAEEQKKALLAQSDETAMVVPIEEQASSSSSSSLEAVPAVVAAPVPSRDYVALEVRLAGSFTGREWTKVEVVLKDASGDVAALAQPTSDIYMRTAFGRAEFRPSVLTAKDFVNGKATVEMLPLGRTTVVVELQPGAILSAPMRYRD